MAVTHSTLMQNDFCDAVTTRLGGTATLEFRTVGDSEVATLAMSATTFPAAASGTMTANAISSDTSATGGTATKFALMTAGTTDVVLGSVTSTSGGGDIELDNNVVPASVEVSMSSLVYNSPA